ncbi:hypothetical protein PM082_004309 [Marasmius tenuissimus]|nr:hypothetical protein PM082_004309 [Marasmius tenuissimus]
MEEKQHLFQTKHQQLKKDNFLGVYGHAHIKALTEANIKLAFAKTGIWPFNPSTVTPEMMAPSKETSSQGSLPVPKPTPVRIVSDMILGVDERARKRAAELSPPVTPSRQRVNQRLRVESNTPAPELPRMGGIPDPFQTPVKNGISALRGTSVSFLLTKSPICASSAALPEFPTIQLSPMNSTQNPALDGPPVTLREEELLRAYRALQRKYESLKEKAVLLQSAMVLNTIYCDCLREQLTAQDEAKKQTKSNKRLMGDGMPRLLTSEAFVKRVEDFTVAVEDFTAAVEEKERLRKEKKLTQAEVAEVRKEYKGLVAQRKKENEQAHDLWIADLELWNEEKKKGKATRRKPFYKHFKLPPIPKPVVLKRKAKEAGLNESQDGGVIDNCISDVSGSSGGDSETDSD